MAAQVLADAIARTYLLLSTSAIAESLWIRSLMFQRSIEALSLLRDSRGSAEWVGGNTYQKEVFIFLYGTFKASAIIEGQMKEDVALVSLHSSSYLSLLQGGQEVLLEGRGHPWILESFQKLQSLSAST